VTNHGPPIPSDALARIFDPFQHADPATTRNGLGLGLYIVQEIARAHGARCDVSSTRKATTFSIRWPSAHPIAQRRAG
jgi:signal transduction histidine kinase